MNCFVHRTVAAVGVCRACGKAVCPECVAPDAPGVACATGTCAARVGELERMLDVNLKLMPRTERLADTAERMRGASERIQSAMADTGRTVYRFNFAIGIGCVVGGSIVVWKGIEWHAYVLSVLGGLLALIGAALTVVGARVVRFYGAESSSASE